MKNFLMLLLTIFFFSCQQKENNSTSRKAADTIITKKNNVEKKENKQIGDTIVMNFRNEKGNFTAEGYLDSIHSKTYIKFNNENLGELKAKIVTAEGKGNIRFNQIIFPDKTSDGPFGMDLNIRLSQKGNYILVIGHSLMADNPFLGKFKVELENTVE
jgi:ABC-type xylose transport system substrate-binding protein